MKREILTIGAVLAVSELSRLALSYKIKNQVIKRDRSRCTEKGRHQGYLEAAHFDHTKNDDDRFYNGLPPYDSKEAARTLCTRHHLVDHLNHAGQNGLTKEDNDMAILTMMRRLNITSLDQL